MQPTSELATVTTPKQGLSREEFAFETRFVVLNYLGQLQGRTSSDGSFSSSGSGSGGRRLHTQSSSSSGSSHPRPPSVSPRAPSASPRPPENLEGDSQVVGAQAFDAKLKVNQAIVQRGKAQDAKERVNAEILSRRQIAESVETEGGYDSVDYDVYDSRKKISEILEKKSREAKVLQELKNLAKARIEEIKSTYDDMDRNRSELTGMVPQSVVPSVKDGAPSYMYEELGMKGSGPSFLNHDSHLADILSPTRPNVLDGLHKTSDLFGEIEKPSDSPAQKITESVMGKRDEIPKPRLPSREKSPAKRAGIPRPSPQDKATKMGVVRRNSTPKVPQEKKTVDAQTGTKEIGRPSVPLDRELSRESEYSADLDSPGMDSDISSLALSGRSVVSATASSRSSVVNLNEVGIHLELSLHTTKFMYRLYFFIIMK